MVALLLFRCYLGQGSDTSARLFLCEPESHGQEVTLLALDCVSCAQPAIGQQLLREVILIGREYSDEVSSGSGSVQHEAIVVLVLADYHAAHLL